jgi:hypothetical protein
MSIAEANSTAVLQWTVKAAGKPQMVEKEGICQQF